MQHVRLLHWKEGEARQRAESLVTLGYRVDHSTLDAAGLRRLREDPPDAVVIDLSRLPSQGRDLALSLRKQKATRHVPLVFVDGDPDKVTRVRLLLPDAVYTTWKQIGEALQEAIASPPAAPVVPASTMAGYAGTPLPKKLGIKEGFVVVLVNAPDGFERVLGELPRSVVLLREEIPVECDLTIWFTRSREELLGRIGSMTVQADCGPMWITWPKKVSKLATDLTQQVVREAGLGSGLVDYKICSIDATWSGLLFTRRKS